ncbi:hypothetical protein KI387_006896, partial [Taxus chinensis]
MDENTAQQNRPQRRNTLCPGELQRIAVCSDDDNAAGFSESGFEDEKMAFEQSVVVSMKRRAGACRGSTLTRNRMKRFPVKVFDELRSQDAMWRSAVFSMYSGFADDMRFRDDRSGLEGFGLLSLDGCLVDAERVDRIGENLQAEQVVGWESLSPLQRVLIVSVAAAAAANSKRGDEIKVLRGSLHDRDQALDVMQRKMNDLWERIFFLQDQSSSIKNNKESGNEFREHEDDINVEGLMNTCSWESRGQGSRKGLGNCKVKTGEAETNSFNPHHAPCAAAILELKRRTEFILEKEAANVMAAFTSVLDKVEGLESHEVVQMHEGIQNKGQGFSLGNLKLSVQQASAQINSLQMSLFDMWHTLLPEALCSVNISPSELDHYLDKAKMDSSMFFPSKQFNTQAWKQWLNMQEHSSFESNFLPNHQSETEEDGFFYKLPVAATEQEERRLSNMSDCTSIASVSEQNIWPSVEVDSNYAIVAAVKKTVDKIIAPCDTQSSGSKDGSQESVAEKLLGELEIAAEKVANMETELGKLKEYIIVCDKKRQDAEEKLAEAVKQGVHNQLNLAAKEEEIARLQKDCKQKDAIIKEMTLAAQRSKAASGKRLTMAEEACKKKNSTIKRLKEDVACLEEKVSQLMSLKIPPSLILNTDSSIPPVMSTNFLFDVDIPSSPDSTEKTNGFPIECLTLDQDLVAGGYSSSSSWGFRRESTGNSRTSSPASGRFRTESTENSRNSSPTSARFRKVLSTGTSRSSSPNTARSRREGLCKNGDDVRRYTNENTKSGSSCSQKITSSRSGNVLSGVDTNSNLKSRRSTESEEVHRDMRNNQISKSKDNKARK